MEPTLMDARECVAAIASNPAAYADLYMQSGVSRALVFEDGKMDSVSSSSSSGTGARIIMNGNTIYAHTTGVGTDSAAAALSEAIAIAGLSVTVPDGRNEEVLATLAPSSSLDASFFHDLDSLLRRECSCLRQATFRFRNSWKSVLIIRGDGTIVEDKRPYTSFSVQVVVERDGALESGHESRASLLPEDQFWHCSPAEDASEIAREALRRALLMLEARPCPAGTMMVLVDSSAGGTMIHEACGHGLEADIIQKDFSVYRDMIGKQVASPLVTIIDDATLPGHYGSYAFDDEGTPAQRTVLVENGILKGYMTDVLSAREGGLPLSGNGRRESYMCAPVPRMSNTFITPAGTACGDLQERVDYGLLVKKMGGGEVNPTSGDFVFHVTEGYLIEKGKVTMPVKGAILTGNGPDALMNVVAVGEQLTLHQGVCGKSGQAVPVTDGQPAILIEQLLVGGCDTDDAR